MVHVLMETTSSGDAEDLSATEIVWNYRDISVSIRAREMSESQAVRPRPHYGVVARTATLTRRSEKRAQQSAEIKTPRHVSTHIRVG